MCVHFIRLIVYFVNIPTAFIQPLKYVQVQIVLSDLFNLFCSFDLVNQLCLESYPPGLVYML